MRQAGDERGGHPVTVRRLAQEELASWSPATQSGHAGLGPGLVDEREAGKVEPGLRRTPDIAGDSHIEPVPLSREDGPFLCRSPSRRTMRQTLA